MSVSEKMLRWGIITFLLVGCDDSPGAVLLGGSSRETEQEASALAFSREYSGSDPLLRHSIGRPLGAAWAASPADGRGYLAFGPYVSDLPLQANSVVFDTTAVGAAVGEIVGAVEIFDSTANQLLGQRDITMSGGGAPAGQVVRTALSLSLTGRAGHALEFRVLANGKASLQLHRIRVSSTTSVAVGPPLAGRTQLLHDGFHGNHFAGGPARSPGVALRRARPARVAAAAM